MRRLINFKNIEQRSRPIIEVIPMVFENNQATQRIVSHHLKRIIHQHRDELQKLLIFNHNPLISFRNS